MLTTLRGIYTLGTMCGTLACGRMLKHLVRLAVRCEVVQPWVSVCALMFS